MILVGPGSLKHQDLRRPGGTLILFVIEELDNNHDPVIRPRRVLFEHRSARPGSPPVITEQPTQSLFQ
jgi:hypothetical protein